MQLTELKAVLAEKTIGLSKVELIEALRKALLDCSIAIALAGGRGNIARDKLGTKKLGFEVDTKHYGQEQLKADCELEVLFEYRQAFQEWLNEVKTAA